jgi:hypothetical protein
MFQVLPIENVPFAFSRPLCSRTLPELRTDMMITRTFLLAGLLFGGAGSWGDAASS